MSDFRAGDHRLTNPLEPRRSYASEQGELLVPESRSTSGVVSVLSSAEREGRWQLPRRFRALAVMGNIELDLRAAEIGYGLSEIEAVAVLGNIEITVSPRPTVGDSLLAKLVAALPDELNGERFAAKFDSYGFSRPG